MITWFRFVLGSVPVSSREGCAGPAPFVLLSCSLLLALSLCDVILELQLKGILLCVASSSRCPILVPSSIARMLQYCSGRVMEWSHYQTLQCCIACFGPAEGGMGSLRVLLASRPPRSRQCLERRGELLCRGFYTSFLRGQGFMVRTWT